MKICIDDGSTNIKMQWSDGKTIKQHVSATTFKRGTSASFGAMKAHNYAIGLQEYTFDELSADTLRTTEVLYQYGDLNLVAVHHALHTSGIKPQPVDIVVTLPISEYYDASHQPNAANIERKQANLMRPLEALARDGFTIQSVDVMPESIPAAVDVLNDLDPSFSLLIVDLGGTTLDIAQVRGKASGIMQIHGDALVGCRIVTQAVQQAMAAAATPCSAWAADQMILMRHDVNFLMNHLNRPEGLPAVQQAIDSSIQILAGQVIQAVEKFQGFSHVLMIGGGAELVADQVSRFLGLRADRFFKTQHSQFDLVSGIYRILL